MEKTYFTHNDKQINVNGTSLIGYIHERYHILVKTFGLPTPADEYKSDAEWEIELPSGEVVTIYNWKNGKNYLGKDGIPVEHIHKWNVGGHNPIAITELKELLYEI